MLCVFLIHKEIINQRATITIEVLIQFYENREVHTAITIMKSLSELLLSLILQLIADNKNSILQSLSV